MNQRYAHGHRLVLASRAATCGLRATSAGTRYRRSDHVAVQHRPAASAACIAGYTLRPCHVRRLPVHADTRMIGHQTGHEDLLRARPARGRLGHAYLLVGAAIGREDGPGPAAGGHAGMHRAGAAPLRRLPRLPESGRGSASGCAADRARGRAAGHHHRSGARIEEEIALAPYEAPHKLFCLTGADTLNDAAASALLKTLEEPPPHAMLVLAAADPAELPSTVRSRCQQLTLQPVPARAIAAGLVGAARRRAGTGARSWRPWRVAAPAGRCRRLRRRSLVERERANTAAMAGLAAAGPFSRLMAVDALAWARAASWRIGSGRWRFLSLLEGWWRDALLIGQGDIRLGVARSPAGRAGAAGGSAAEIVAFLGRIQEAAARVEANVAPRLVLEHLIGSMPSGGVAHGR